jgi:formate hydrogenlyase subunit 3/multisubunit Na+/H+ antiporter MnhD subunit
MLYVIIPPALFALGAIIYMALSRKSSLRTRIAALIALGLMFLSVIACIVLLISGGLGAEGNVLIPLDPPADTAAAPSNDIWLFLTFIVFLAALFVVIAVLSIRERRRRRNEKNAARSRERVE